MVGPCGLTGLLSCTVHGRQAPSSRVPTGRDLRPSVHAACESSAPGGSDPRFRQGFFASLRVVEPGTRSATRLSARLCMPFCRRPGDRNGTGRGAGAGLTLSAVSVLTGEPCSHTSWGRGCFSGNCLTTVGEVGRVSGRLRGVGGRQRTPVLHLGSVRTGHSALAVPANRRRKWSRGCVRWLETTMSGTDQPGRSSSLEAGLNRAPTLCRSVRRKVTRTLPCGIRLPLPCSWRRPCNPVRWCARKAWRRPSGMGREVGGVHLRANRGTWNGHETVVPG